MRKINQLMLAVLMAVAPVPAVSAGAATVISVFTEAGGNVETTGVALGMRQAEVNGLYLQGGLSYQRITLQQYPADYDGGRFRPVFLYGRIGLDWWAGPYVQAGFDLNSSLMHWLDTNSNSCCNANVRAGLEVKLHQNIRLDLYGNWYNFHYNSLQAPVTPIDYQPGGENRRFSRTSVGAQLSLLF